jgi:hypothetical protein
VVHASGVVAVQLTPQALDWHARDPVVDPDTGAVHCIGQAPQWSGSLCVSTHFPSQLVVSPGHEMMQELPEHTSFWAQVLAQVPQCWLSFVKFTHALPQVENPESHDIEHSPPWHTGRPLSGAGHALPHVPQLAVDVWVSTHWAPHFVNAGEHEKSHRAALHVASPLAGAPQTMPHAPQFAVSL